MGFSMKINGMENIKKGMDAAVKEGMIKVAQERLSPFGEEVKKYNIQLHWDEANKTVAVRSDKMPEDIAKRITSALTK